jgi:predicted P-loop ATPase
MKIKLSINKNIVNKVEKPTAHGWHNVEMTAQELLDHIKSGFAFSQGVLKENHDGSKPAKKDVEYAHLLPIDIDNDVTDPIVGKRKKTEQEQYLSYDTVVNNKWIHKHCLFVYTTASHTEEHHKFRMVFLLPEPLFDPDDYSEVAKAFNNRLGADPTCNNIDRLFFGNVNTNAHVFGGVLTHEDIIKIKSGKADEAKATKEYKDSGLNGSISSEMIAEMLSHVPPVLEYNDWFGIVSAIGNYMPNDLDTACKLIDDWSPDSQRGTMWRLKHRGSKFSIGTLIYHANQNGFDKSKIYPKKEKELSNRSVNADGKINKRGRKSDKPSVQEIQDYLSEHYEFRYNVIKSYVEFKRKTEATFAQVTDRIENSLWCELDSAGLSIPVGDLTKILMSDFVPEYHPFKEYFNNLPDWDGIDHIQSYIDAVNVEEGQEETWKIYFTRWIVATVACATETMRKDFKARSVNHTCIVLVGDQGLGKSTIVNRLVPEQLADYYAVTQINPNDKDSKILVTETFLINLDELESSTREEIASLKSLITVEQIATRKPYARRSEAYIRRASFIGSVNKSMFLTDITGSRRFLPVDVVSIDFSAKIDIDQLYAQAMHYLHEIDFKYWFDKDEIKVLNELNKKYQVISPEEELISRYFKPYEIDGSIDASELKRKEAAGVLKLMTATDIYDFLQKKTEVKMSYHKLGQFLKNLGYHQRSVRRAESVRRCYVIAEINDNESISF